MKKNIKIKLPFGKKGLIVEIPRSDFFQSLLMKKEESLKDIDKAVTISLTNPIESPMLGKIAQGKKPEEIKQVLKSMGWKEEVILSIL